MHRNIDVHYYFEGVLKPVEESIRKYVEENVTKKMDAYFKKVLLSHDDARIGIRVNIERHKGDDERHDGTFLFTLNGKDYPPYKREGDRAFENVHDLVNHAFDHLKEQIASEKEKKVIQMPSQKDTTSRMAA